MNENQTDLTSQLSHAPANLVMYVLGLIGAVVDDYTLVTLLVFCVLLGFVLEAILIPVTVFFGLYFVVRLVGTVANALTNVGQGAFQGGQMQAQSTMQIAAALAQFHPPVQQSEPHDAPGVGLRGE